MDCEVSADFAAGRCIICANADEKNDTLSATIVITKGYTYRYTGIPLALLIAKLQSQGGIVNEEKTMYRYHLGRFSGGNHAAGCGVGRPRRGEDEPDGSTGADRQPDKDAAASTRRIRSHRDIEPVGRDVQKW